jgi:hypothetical protein
MRSSAVSVIALAVISPARTAAAMAEAVSSTTALTR